MWKVKVTCKPVNIPPLSHVSSRRWDPQIQIINLRSNSPFSPKDTVLSPNKEAVIRFPQKQGSSYASSQWVLGCNGFAISGLPLSPLERSVSTGSLMNGHQNRRLSKEHPMVCISHAVQDISQENLIWLWVSCQPYVIIHHASHMTIHSKSYVYTQAWVVGLSLRIPIPPNRNNTTQSNIW